MRILLINVPHPSIGSRIPDDHLPPLGLLAIGGPLIDDGHDVRLIDAEFGPMSTQAIVAEALGFFPDAVLFGHSGSTSGHPVIAQVARSIAAAVPRAHIIYGGVFPTYYWRDILAEEPYVTAIVRGEGEETARRLIAALQHNLALADVPGIAYRDIDGLHATRQALVIRDSTVTVSVGSSLTTHATLIGAGYGPWSSSSRAVAHTSATIAGNAASGRGGAIAIPSFSQRNWRAFTASMTSR
jgi:anaerobic magnesium-protoporphyrin IX monomethyl ester cyclase